MAEAGQQKIGRRHLIMPATRPGMIVGLFGGSFNPPHAGHALVSEIALRRLKLDRLWWMVTPGNPLKAMAISHRFQSASPFAKSCCTTRRCR